MAVRPGSKPPAPWGRRLRRATRRTLRALPAPRDEAALRAARALRDLVAGRTPPASPKPVAAAKKPAAKKPAPKKPAASRPKLVKGTPIPEDAPWATPEGITGSGLAESKLYPDEDGPIVFDVALLDKLNAEYAERRLVPSPPTYDAASLTAAARRRIGWVHNMVDLRGKRTLEIGCGNGFEVWALAHNLDADAHGVDVVKYGPWDQLADDRVHFACADMSVEHPYPSNYFDRILSFTVWEHVLHPYAMLQAAYDVLAPGGVAWIRANLYAGPQASHRYRDIYFPWPHLLFTDETIREWDRQQGREPRGSAWVNRLSSLHYDHYVQQIGFEVVQRTFTEVPIDEEFYRRFQDVLGRFPRTDLQRDYVLLVLRKPA